MIWKFDWAPGDNYAHAGVTDYARLLSNYNELKALLNAEYGFNIAFTTPTTSGYATVPFGDVLNSTEAAMNALHVWMHEWIDKAVTWQAVGTMPTAEDINRWEKNGWAIEQAAARIKAAWFHLGEIYSGEVTT